MPILTPPTCSQCGYDLTGLAAGQGRCPECGQSWDRQTGQGLEQSNLSTTAHQSRRINRLRTWGLLFATAMVLTCGGLGTLIAANPLRPLAIAGILVAVLLLAALTSYVYEDG